jgi:uncharacterized protein YbjQ (UPF0145 family)
MAVCDVCGKELKYFDAKVKLEAENSMGLPEGIGACASCYEFLRKLKRGELYQATLERAWGEPSEYSPIQAALFSQTLFGDGKTAGDERSEAITNMLVTTTPLLQGYTITAYHGFVSAEVALGLGFFKGIAAGLANIAGTSSDSFSGKLKGAKESVLNAAKTEAHELGGNAIVGLNFEYVNFEGMTGAVVVGTAVTIERDDSQLPLSRVDE